VAAISFLQLSQSRQMLVRLCQSTNFGSVQDLIVEAGEPIFAAPPSIVLQEVKLDSEDPARSEAAQPDFVLCAAFTRLIALLDRIGNGKISKIEIRAGLPPGRGRKSGFGLFSSAFCGARRVCSCLS
jgi:hypothetical protein